MSEFRMPSLGSDMEAGILVEQSVAPGDTVRAGDVIGAVETQKGVIEIEVFHDGTFERWLADIGKTVPVGAPLAMIRGAGDPPEQEPVPPETVPIPPDTEPIRPVTTPEPPEVVPLPPETEPTPPETEPVEPEIEPGPSELPDMPAPEPSPIPEEAPEPPFVEPEAPPPEIEPEREMASAARPRVTPAARRLAAERGIDLMVLGQSLDRPIKRRDIEALPSEDKGNVATDFRSAIAAAMSRSKREIPHYYLSHEVDLTAADAFVTAENAGRAPSDRLLIGAVCAKAVAAAIAKYPEFNGHYTNDRFHPSEEVHLGFAINIRSGGLVAPALFDTDSLSLDELMHNMRDLTARVRAGRFRARELSDATVTLTSLGERGTDAVFGVIYPPQVAIVGMGAPRLRPAVLDGKLEPRLMATFSLAADHRVSDGHRGALFLRAIDKNLQTPERL